MPVIVLPCTSLCEVVSLASPELGAIQALNKKWIMDGSGPVDLYGLGIHFLCHNAIVFEVELCQVKMDPTRLKKLAEEQLTLLHRICCTFTLMLARRHIITHRVLYIGITSFLPQWNLQALYIVCSKRVQCLRIETMQESDEGVRPAEAAADVVGVAGVCFEMNEMKRYSKNVSGNP